MILPPLYFITREDSSLSHVQQVQRACQAGIKAIQLRMKEASYTEYVNAALAARDICRAYGVMLIINDNVTVVREVGADGVHLGKHDMSPQKAREILGSEAVIGCTANTEEDVLQLLSYSIDYIGLGPYRFTNTKKKLSPILGPMGVQSIASALEKREDRVPVVAVGGILVDEISEVCALGVQSVAISADIINRLKSSQSISYSTPVNMNSEVL